MRLGIAGMHVECGTFSPLTSGVEDFPATRGAEMMERYPFLLERPDLTKGVEWVPLVHFRAMPGGVVRREGYEEMKAEILGALRGAGDLDGFLFDVRGAMSVEGIDDAELDLLRDVRKVIGPDLPVACSEALHGNVSAALVAETVDYTRLQRPMFPLDRKFGWEPKVTVLG